MANEFSFMFIDIENTIDLYKMGLIDEGDFINRVQHHLDEYQNEIALNRNLSRQHRDMVPTVDKLMMK